MVPRTKSVLRQMWFGAILSAVIVSGAIVFNVIYGQIYGRWGWMEISTALLILAICAMAGLESFFRQPNPFTRTYALYNMQDIPPHQSLQGEGFGWMIQAVPMFVMLVLLALAIWLF